MSRDRGQRWQHRRPKDIDECPADPVRPKAPGHLRCAVCGDPVIRVDANEGPEALKALFRL